MLKNPLQRMARRLCVLLIAATSLSGRALSGPVAINIDMGGALRAVPPDETYAAGGVSGVWNLIAPDSSGDFGSFELIDVSGQTTGAVLSMDGAPWELRGDLGRSFFNSGRDDGEARLMGDYIVNFRSVDIRGLEPGSYLLLAYGANHAGEPYPQRIRVNGDPQTDTVYGGVWRGASVAGETHAVLEVVVGSGDLSIQALDGDPFLNGLQIVPIPEPASFFACLIGLSLLGRHRQRRPDLRGTLRVTR